MNYLTETELKAMGQRQRPEDHGKVTFASISFFFLPPSLRSKRFCTV